MFQKLTPSISALEEKLNRMQRLALEIKYALDARAKAIVDIPISPMFVRDGHVEFNHDLLQARLAAIPDMDEEKRELVDIWISLFSDLGMIREYTALSMADRLLKDYNQSSATDNSPSQE